MYTPGRSALIALLTAVLVSLVVVEATGQTATLRGFVRDSQTMRPLQGASIVLQQEGRIRVGTATDGDGYFILPRVPPDQYDMIVTFVGYAPAWQSIDVRRDRQDFMRIVLVPAAQSMDEVVIEVQAEGGITAVSAGLQVVQPADIQRVPVLGASGDLAGYLQTIPGVAIQGDRGGQFFVRGGSTDQNLALLDGIPIYQPFHIVSFYSAFPEEIVDHADVYTAGFGAAYSTRLSSVMDVSTRNGNKERLSGSAAIAPFLSGARLEGPIIPERVSFVASARQSLVEELTPNLYGQRQPYRFGDRFAKLHAFVGANHTVSVTGLSTTDRGNIAGSVTNFDGSFVPRESDDDSDREVSWTNRAVGGRYAYRSRRLPLFLEMHTSTSRSTNEIGPQDVPERSASIESTDASLVASVFGKPGEFKVGARWRESTMAYELGGQFQDLEVGSVKTTEINAFAEAVSNVGSDRLSVNPGVNVYVIPDRNDLKVDPRLRMTWSVPLAFGLHTAHAAFGRFHQLIVGLSDERDVGNVFTAWVPAADSLELPAAWHAVSGWSSKFPGGIGFAVEGYVKTFSSLSVPVFSPFPGFTTALQPADGTARGLDVRIETDARPFINRSTLSGYVSYALSDVEYRTDTFSYHPAQHRTHQVNAMVRVERDGLGLIIQWQYGSGFPLTKSAGFDVWQYLTPASQVSSDPGTIRVLYLEPFGGRQPNYERVDVWLDKVVDLGRARATVRAGIVNLLNRNNLFYFDLFTLRRVDQMPLTPSVGFKVELL